MAVLREAVLRFATACRRRALFGTAERIRQQENSVRIRGDVQHPASHRGRQLSTSRGNQEGEDSRQYITRSKEGTTASESSAGGADVRRQGGASTSGAATASPKWLPPELQRTLKIAIVGAPNAGKSTLTNLLVGTQVTAVSQKTNTTRRETLGAVTLGDTQLVITDTPGVVSAASMRSGGQTSRVASAWRAAASADMLLFLVDSHRQATNADPRVVDLAAALTPELEKACYTEASGVQPPPVVLVQNKIDLLPKPRSALISSVAFELAQRHPFAAAFAISAEHEHGVEELLEYLVQNAEERPWELPPDRAFPGSPAVVALEIVREAVFERLHEELPYKIVIRHVSWRELGDGSVRVEHALMVANNSQRKMVVGEAGATVGQMGISARRKVEKALGRRVHLILNVKVAVKRGRRAAFAESSGADESVGGRGLVA